MEYNSGAVKSERAGNDLPDVLQAPLIPIALAATAGILLDRWTALPTPLAVLGVVIGLAAWGCARRSSLTLALFGLCVALAGLAALYHHSYCNTYAADDVGNFATVEPQLVVLRGLLAEEPTVFEESGPEPLRSYSRPASTRSTVRVHQLKHAGNWVAASGLLRVFCTGKLERCHVDDEVEVTGLLQTPAEPSNPGEFDYRAHLRDQRIRAVLQAKDAAGILCVGRGWWGTAGRLAALRGWCHRTLTSVVPQEQQGTALALLLGEDAALEQSAWEKYQRTGVIHALAISGQHLVALAAVAWFLFRLLQVPRRRGAWLLAVLLLIYALLTGARPPVMRATATVLALCLGTLLRRRVQRANTFALGWLLVLCLNPTDIFNGGCQLSFLAVAVLFWAVPGWTETEREPLEFLVEQSRPSWQRTLLWMGKQVWLAYLVGLIVWLALAPLLAARYHLLPPVALIIGPPVVLLTTLALFSGFVALLTSWCWPIAQVAGWLTGLLLRGCDLLVASAENWPGAWSYVADVPVWWLWVFYPLLLAALTLPLLRKRWPLLALAGLAWLCVGLLSAYTSAREFRCTFLAVGHGGCTVLETEDGRTILYDAGAISGPDVARRCIAPYLWSRGVGRIDEVFLSHADLDHFNGLHHLLERFAVGQVTCTPSFQDNRHKPAVEFTLTSLRRRGVSIRIVSAGDRLRAGEVDIEVLHPPALGPAGNENARSMVLLVSRAGQQILLTGDLEEAGLERVLTLPRRSVSVCMAPHHGSRTANRPELAAWARPRVVVSCEGRPRGKRHNPYQAVGARLLTTWEHGAVSFRARAGSLWVETYRSGERWQVAP